MIKKRKTWDVLENMVKDLTPIFKQMEGFDADDWNDLASTASDQVTDHEYSLFVKYLQFDTK